MNKRLSLWGQVLSAGRRGQVESRGTLDAPFTPPEGAVTVQLNPNHTQILGTTRRGVQRFPAGSAADQRAALVFG